MQDEAIVDEPLGTEQVEVERVVLDRWVEAPVPVRQEGDTTIITLHEEVIVVEKRLKATEEVHLIRRQTTRSAPQQVTLRREEVVIEHVDAATGKTTRTDRLAADAEREQLRPNDLSLCCISSNAG